MLEFLPKEVRDGLELARKRDRKRQARLRLQVGNAVFPVLRLSDDEMEMDASLTPHLRGLVDLFDGARHIAQCLIVATTQENGVLICEFKRLTNVTEGPALDYWRDENAPVALLTKGRA
jgi:hypothetical protein